MKADSPVIEGSTKDPVPDPILQDKDMDSAQVEA